MSESSWNYINEYYDDRPAVDAYELLARHHPNVVEGYADLRESLFREPPDGAIPVVYKELMIVAMECMIRKTNPPPEFHARKAIEEGATVAQVSEAVCLAIILGGMISYHDSGKYALIAAEKAAAEKAAERAAAEQAAARQP